MLKSLLLPLIAALLALGGCASTTTVELNPSPQDPVCASSANALILWMPEWRVDQKDTLSREAAAGEGLSRFFEKSGCFKSASIRRIAQSSNETIQAAVTEATTRNERVLLIAVQELGPTVKIGSSLALVEGGTEVVLKVSEYINPRPAPRVFTALWRHGGPGVLKGVATLPQDMQAALGAALRPSLE